MFFCLAQRVSIGRRFQASLWWQKQRKAFDHEEVQFIIYFKQQNLDVLHSHFIAISSPDSPQYRQFMTFEEVEKLGGKVTIKLK